MSMMLSRHQKNHIPGLALVSILLIGFIVQWSNADVAHASSTVTITPTQQYQKIQGWGTSLAWWANIIGGWSNSKRTAVADAIFDPTKGIGLNVVRYNFGADGPTNVCTALMKPGHRVPSFEPTAGTYNWTQDANQLWIAQAAKARGADVFEGFVNSAPAWMLNNSCTAGGAGGAENLNPAHYNDFVNYMATIDKHFHDSFGITLQTVDAFNEPTHTWWKSTNNQEGMMVSQANQDKLIPLLSAALKQNGASAYTSISAPDNFAISESLNGYNAYSSTSKADLAQWNTHGYRGSNANRTAAYTTIGQTDHKRLWMSEWNAASQGSTINAALTLSNEILTDEQYLHPSAWVNWQAVNEAGDPIDTVRGLAYRDSNDNISYPARYYAMGNYSKFVREGYQMIGNSDANSFTAYNASSHSLVIVTTNSATTPNAATYNLANFSKVGTTATPYQTSNSENLKQLGNSTIANKTFSVTLPAQSITTFVISNVTQ
jgi:O-glycosyl hydrolase